jgi:hypothetical protein
MSLPKQFVYAQQDILGGTKKTNDLVVVNDADYRDSGICVGPGGPYNNMRLAYSVSDSAGSITTDTLNVNVEQLFFKNLPSAQSIRKSCNYLVADVSGNVKEGYPQFTGDINSEVSTIKDDIILIKQSLGLPIVKTITIESILSYIAIGLCILFLIILIILLIRVHRLNKRLEKTENLLEEITQYSIQPQQPQYSYEPDYTQYQYTQPPMSPMRPQSQQMRPIIPQMPPMSSQSQQMRPMSPRMSPMSQQSQQMSPMSQQSQQMRPMSPRMSPMSQQSQQMNSESSSPRFSGLRRFYY